jgi:hypothetical protein
VPPARKKNSREMFTEAGLFCLETFFPRLEPSVRPDLGIFGAVVSAASQWPVFPYSALKTRSFQMGAVAVLFAPDKERPLGIMQDMSSFYFFFGESKGKRTAFGPASSESRFAINIRVRNCRVFFTINCSDAHLQHFFHYGPYSPHFFIGKKERFIVTAFVIAAIRPLSHGNVILSCSLLMPIGK